MNRRKFIRSAAVVSTVALSHPSALFAGHNPAQTEIGLQIYTLRDQIQRDLTGTLEKVAKIGYNYVELFGYREGTYFGRSIKEMRKILKKAGLNAISCHVPTGSDDSRLKGTVTNNFERAAADAKALGHEYVVCPWLSENERKTIDNYKKLANHFNRAGEICKQYGLSFAYHNHDFEFIPIKGQIPYDVLLAETDPDYVKMELDLYWIAKAGVDYQTYFNRHPARFPLWHVKDMDKTPEKGMAEVGNGVIPWKTVFASRQISGMKRFFVEQDYCKGDPFESITMSYKYLKSIL
jgi:sugar phosphate isomerase/epimerase